MTNTFLKESTKFRVLPAPIQVPGVCASCGSSNNNDRDYVDFDLTIDFHGVIYLCTFCFSECANAIGFISPEQARELETKLEATEKKILDFYTKEKALDEAINFLRNSGLFDLNDDSASFPREVSDSQVDGSSEQDNHGTNESDQHIKQQDSKQGSVDLSAAGNNE